MDYFNQGGGQDEIELSPVGGFLHNNFRWYNLKMIYLFIFCQNLI